MINCEKKFIYLYLFQKLIFKMSSDNLESKIIKLNLRIFRGYPKKFLSIFKNGKRFTQSF